VGYRRRGRRAEEQCLALGDRMPADEGMARPPGVLGDVRAVVWKALAQLTPRKLRLESWMQGSLPSIARLEIVGQRWS